MTPEQSAKALERARSLLAEANALLAEREEADRLAESVIEHQEIIASQARDLATIRAKAERLEKLALAYGREIDAANANAQDAARWRAVREEFYPTSGGRQQSERRWKAEICRVPGEKIDEAADRLIAEEEAQS